MSNGAAAGTTMPGTAGRRFGSATRPSTGAGSSGSGWPSPQLTRSADAGMLTHGQNPVPSAEGQKADTMPGLVAKSDDW